PYVDFSLEAASAHARKLNKDIEIFPVACRTHEGLEAWYDWLRKARASKR
ncbi:MAG: hydrogenase accessory protein HypB, partial [Desulfovibrio sp.]|nr:hydrogenase accessory protein HypB [Desulfovibrio sp.]